LLLLLLGLLAGCRSDEPSISNAEVVELKEFETILNLESERLAVPGIIKYDDSSGQLFVYDIGQVNVFELDISSGKVINEYGREGRGPGEYQQVNSILPVEDHLFLVDHYQHYIHKYNRDGGLASSMDYGAIVISFDPLTTLSSMTMGSIPEININNQPFVTLQGHVLLRPGRDRINQSIYELRDWEGNYLSDIGEIPEGSMFIPEGSGDVYRSDVSNRETPSILKPYAFPVSDLANPEELFLVYSSIPMIAKYTVDGEKLWKVEVTGVPELDVIADNYFESMEQQNRNNERTSIGMLTKYTSGVSSTGGDLYLGTYTDPNNRMTDSDRLKPLWIHRFDTTGELNRRYKIISEDVGITSIFDIDFSARRIFVVTVEGEIRAYSY
ncbi:MAG: 6-bladed beta-propeller, partial [Balneolales bacterium]